MFIPARAKSGSSFRRMSIAAHVHLGALVQTGAVHSGALVKTAAHKQFSFL
jgi:hypothetical protein